MFLAVILAAFFGQDMLLIKSKDGTVNSGSLVGKIPNILYTYIVFIAFPKCSFTADCTLPKFCLRGFDFRID